jgi:hypothetical protein
VTVIKESHAIELIPHGQLEEMGGNLILFEALAFSRKNALEELQWALAVWKRRRSGSRRTLLTIGQEQTKSRLHVSIQLLSIFKSAHYLGHLLSLVMFVIRHYRKYLNSVYY